MGWLVGWSTKQAMIDHLTQDMPGRSKLLRHSVVGSHLWLLAQAPNGGEKFIVLALLQYNRGAGPHNNDWGYKDLDESSGPYYYDCPITMLRASTCADKNAVEWRKHALQWHEEKKAHSKAWKCIQVGDVVSNGDRKVVVTMLNCRSPSVFTKRQHYAGQFAGYWLDDPDKQWYRFKRRNFTPV